MGWGFAFRVHSQVSHLTVHGSLSSQVSSGFRDGLRALFATLVYFLFPVTSHRRLDGLQRRLILVHVSSRARSNTQTVPTDLFLPQEFTHKGFTLLALLLISSHPPPAPGLIMCLCVCDLKRHSWDDIPIHKMSWRESLCKNHSHTYESGSQDSPLECLVPGPVCILSLYSKTTRWGGQASKVFTEAQMAVSLLSFKRLSSKADRCKLCGQVVKSNDLLVRVFLQIFLFQVADAVLHGNEQ